MLEAGFLKMAGSVLVIGASTLMGFFYSRKGALRREQLLEMKRAFTIFKNEIRFQMTPFGEAAASVAKRVESPAAEVFAAASELALSKRAADAKEIWERAVESLDCGSYCTKEDIAAFKNLGKNLGYLDKEMQSQSIDLLMEYIDGAAGEIQEKGEKEAKMYRSLGFLGGLLVAVVLI